MLLTDLIEKIILEELGSAGGSLELQRKALAKRVGCVPSQINYVISSRFTSANGYLIESRRGGGGYVRITRIRLDRNEYLMHCFQAIGSEIDRASGEAVIRNLQDYEITTPAETRLMLTAISDGSLAAALPDERNRVRADLLRQFILTLEGYNKESRRNSNE